MIAAEHAPQKIAGRDATGPGAERMPHLDMVRGLAALAVVLGHLRGFFMVDYAQTGQSIAVKLVYGLTGLHHQAVMVFFVLSGFLVGGSVVRQCRRGQFDWGQYLLRRLCRLWIVIVPALALTAFWDSLGAHLVPAGYAGAWHAQFNSGPDPAFDLSPGAYLGNVAFLQTIFVVPYGSNGPLWSLANEFWYYILFPLALQATLGAGSLLRRVSAAAALLGLILFLPREMLLLGLIWLFGVGAFLAFDHAPIARWISRWPVAAVAAVALAAALGVGRAHPSGYDDFVIGALFAAIVPWLARVPARSGWYRKAGFGLSEMSYTLYLVHFPLLAWLYFVLLAPAQLAFGAASLAVLSLVLAGVFAYAVAVWWLFERNTERVRAWIVRRLRLGRTGIVRGAS